jgi:hypothetical protein
VLLVAARAALLMEPLSVRFVAKPSAVTTDQMEASTWLGHLPIRYGAVTSARAAGVRCDVLCEKVFDLA